MPLSWNEIRHNAIRFSNEWTGETREHAEAKSFWDDFFSVFGIRRRTVASFEEPVKKISGDYGYIDLFWPAVLIVEHKSFGHDLGKAQSQAFRYIQDLARDPERQKQLPRYIIVSDFARIALHDLEPDDQRGLPLFDKVRVATVEFPLAEFHRHIHAFAFIPGYKQHKLTEENPANIEAVELLGLLHDALEFGGYTGHDLERFLVRVLFCLFAEDTGLFERESFKLYIENRTASDGSDLGPRLAQLFHVLNTPTDKRQQNLDEELKRFPYVNGELFHEHLGFAEFNRDMRNALLACTNFQWSQISPAIFGSLFQSIMEPKERRQIGAHYTSERDIMKVIRSLFLDDLREEFENRKKDRSTARRARLEEFHKKLCSLNFLDPACGCGNFLVIAYRELRQLELETLEAIFSIEVGESAETKGKRVQREFTLDEVNRLSQVDVDQFFGIEIGEWPARIAEVALWLMDHQMNLKVSEAFGQLYQRLPLKKSPHIHCANALRLDWKTVIPPEKCSFILGNPPFIGAKFQSDEQRAEMDLIAAEVETSGLLDYVTGWYFKAAEFVAGTRTVVGFVSTNSISQGEQVGVLWNFLFQHYKVKIHFAHRTFSWESEARGKAHVHVVIVGFASFDVPSKRIYDYEGEKPTTALVKNISPYLVEGSGFAITNRSKPICQAPEIKFGNQPIDGGHLLLDPAERADLLSREPEAKKFLRLFIGADEFINGQERWCLWLEDAGAAELRGSPEISKRVQAVREFRLASKRPATRELAETPTRFAFISHVEKNYLLIPSVSSERRKYIPMGFMPPKTIASNLCLIIPGANLLHFGVLSSAMHMAWTRQVCGRMKSDYRYSNKLVYNNFPWPELVSSAQRRQIESLAQQVLDLRVELGDGRAGFLPSKTTSPTATLADLYDPLFMPPALQKAHLQLDRAVEKCYRPEPFHSDRERVEFLFALYEKLTAPLLPTTPPRRRRSQATKTEKSA